MKSLPDHFSSSSISTTFFGRLCEISKKNQKKKQNKKQKKSKKKMKWFIILFFP